MKKKLSFTNKCKFIVSYWSLHFFSFSRALAAEGRHAKPNSYRTHPFIFVWSSLSALNGSRVRTYDDDDDVAQHGAHTSHLMHCIHLCNLILEIRQIKVSADHYRMTILHAQVGTHQGKVFFEVNRWPAYRFSLDHWLKCFPKLLQQAKQPVLRFKAWLSLCFRGLHFSVTHLVRG